MNWAAMLRKLSISLTVSALALYAMTAPILQSSPPTQARTPLLRLQRGTFDARQPGPALQRAAWLEATSGSYDIVQFIVPPTVGDRDRLIDTGVQIREYLPDFAYLVQGTMAQLEAASRLPDVYATTP